MNKLRLVKSMRIYPLATYQLQRKSDNKNLRKPRTLYKQSFMGRSVIPPMEFPKLMHIYNNRAVDMTTRAISETHEEAYSLLQQFRAGDSNIKNMFNRMINIAASCKSFDDIYNAEPLNLLHRIFRIEFFTPLGSGNVKYNPFDYHKIYRTIGESEYENLINGHHIVAPSCNNESVMVTNNPAGVDVCSGLDCSTKSYFVCFKDKINFDPLAKHFYSLENLQCTECSNAGTAEYNLIGGYNIEDVEQILDFSSKEAVYPKG